MTLQVQSSNEGTQVCWASCKLVIQHSKPQKPLLRIDFFFFLVFVFSLYFQSDVPQYMDCNKTTEVKTRSYWPDFGTADNPQGSATILHLHVSVSQRKLETSAICRVFPPPPTTNLSINSRTRNKSGNHRSSKYAPRFQNVAPCCSLVIALVCTI